MRGLAAITAFALFLAVPVWAQHGGGHAGGFGGGHGGGFSGGHGGGFVGGHGGGFSGGHGGFSGGHIAPGHSFGGVRGPSVGRGFPHLPSSRASVSRPFMHNQFRGSRNGFRNRGFRDRGFRDHRFRNCGGFGCGWGYGYPWWGSAYIDPWLWWDSGSSYDEDYDRDRELADQMNTQNLEDQRMLRQEEADGDQDYYARPPLRQPERPAQEKPEQAAAPLMPSTVLVFRDQHKQEVENYAIVGQTLWAFAPQRNQKIALSDLDLAATAKANDDRGLTFRVPAANEAQ